VEESPGLACPTEASECLVGSSVFKTDGGSIDPRRVRFPSASAIDLVVELSEGDVGLARNDLADHIGGKSAGGGQSIDQFI
jgi:hypothetical protein